MPSVPPLETRDLRSYTGKHLKPLLQEEARVWRARLLWDYGPSVDLLMRYVDARILPGLVAYRTGTSDLLGYCFSVYEGQKAVVGDVFARPGEGAREIERQLVRAQVETLQNTPGIDRIEAQLLLHNTGTLTKVFTEAAFTSHERVFMECDLKSPSVMKKCRAVDAVIPENLRLVRWANSHFQLAGDLIHRSYIGHGDSLLNDQYHSIHGSLRFLHNIVRFPGCGVFDPEGSLVLWDDRTNTMQGLLLCSVVDRGVAHITQLCLAPNLRGLGLGRQMLANVAEALNKRGFGHITLTATRDNSSAMRLYKDLGFKDRVTFDAMVWQRNG